MTAVSPGKARIIADGTDGLPFGHRRPEGRVRPTSAICYFTYLSRVPDTRVVVLISTDGGKNFQLLTMFTDEGADQPSSCGRGPGPDGKPATASG